MLSEDDGRVESGNPATAHVRLLGLLIERLGLDCAAEPYSFCNHPMLGRSSLAVDARSEPIPLQAAWATLVGEVADAGRDLVHTSRPTLWLAVAPQGNELPHLPNIDVCLAHHWYWGVLSPVDLLVAAADAGLDEDATACAVEVVRWDLEMLSELGEWDGTVDGLMSRGIEWPDVDGCDVLVPMAQEGRPSPESLAAWARGLTERWDGTSCAHLAVEMKHRPDAAAVRIWAGQVARVLPFIELERARLAEWFAQAVDRQGGVTAGWAAAHGDDIASLEIGPLWACVHAHRRVHVPQMRFDLLRDLKDARNAIAHRRPLPAATVRSLRQRAIADQANP